MLNNITMKYGDSNLDFKSRDENGVTWIKIVQDSLNSYESDDSENITMNFQITDMMYSIKVEPDEKMEFTKHPDFFDIGEDKSNIDDIVVKCKMKDGYSVFVLDEARSSVKIAGGKQLVADKMDQQGKIIKKGDYSLTKDDKTKEWVFSVHQGHASGPLIFEAYSKGLTVKFAVDNKNAKFIQGTLPNPKGEFTYGDEVSYIFQNNYGAFLAVDQDKVLQSIDIDGKKYKDLSDDEKKQLFSKMLLN